MDKFGALCYNGPNMRNREVDPYAGITTYQL